MVVVEAAPCGSGLAVRLGVGVGPSAWHPLANNRPAAVVTTTAALSTCAAP